MPSKIYPNWDFWYENIPSGNPAFQASIIYPGNRKAIGQLSTYLESSYRLGLQYWPLSRLRPFHRRKLAQWLYKYPIRPYVFQGRVLRTNFNPVIVDKSYE
jgi:hypothetical protein